MEPFLTSRRLSFRHFEQQDFEFLYSMLSDPVVMRCYPHVFDREGTQEWLDRIHVRQERDGHSFWLLMERETQQPIGQVGLLKQEVDGGSEAEIGYMLHRAHWQQGFAAEAAATVRDYAFHELGKRRVISLIRPMNIPSQRVALSYGAKPEKLVTWRELEHLVFALAR